MTTTPAHEPTHHELQLARVEHAEQDAQEARRVFDRAHAALEEAKDRGLSTRKQEPVLRTFTDAGDILVAARGALGAERTAVLAHFAWQRIVPLLAEPADGPPATDDLRGNARPAASLMCREVVAYLDAQAMVHVLHHLCLTVSDGDAFAEASAGRQAAAANRERANAGLGIVLGGFTPTHEMLLAAGGDALLGDHQIIDDLIATMPVPTPEEEEREHERLDLASMWPNAREHATVDQATRDVEWAVAWLARACTDAPAKSPAHQLRLWVEIAERALALGEADRSLRLAEQSTGAMVDDLILSMREMAEHETD